MGKLGLVYTASRLVGLARELAIAYALGTSAAADRVSGAFLMASATGLVVGEAVFAGAVARIGGSHDQRERAARFAEVFRAAARLALLACLLYLVLGSAATAVLLGAWGDALDDTLLLGALLAPSVGAYVASAAINGWLTIERRFVLLNSVQVLYSVGAIGFLLVAWAAGLDIAPEAVVAGWSVGNLTALAVLMRIARPGRVRVDGIAVRRLVAVGAPLAIGSALLVAQSITDRAVAARLEVGDVAALGYADRLFLLPVGFVLAVVGPIVLGALTTVAAADEPADVGAGALDHLRLLSAFAVPVTLAFAALAPLAVPVLFEYGAFTEASTDTTSKALSALVCGLAATSLVLVLIRVLQAARRYRELIRLTALAAIINLPLSVAGGVALGVDGVALATSITAAITAVLGIEQLAGHFGTSWRAAARRAASIPVAAVTAGLIALFAGELAGALGEGGRLAIAGAAAMVAAGAASRTALSGRRRGYC